MSLSDPAFVRTAQRRLKRIDQELGRVIEAVGDWNLQLNRGGYEVLVRAIISQQISTSAARSIFTKLKALLPEGRVKARSIHELTDEQLQQAGVSPQKRGYLRDLTTHAVNGTINFRRIAKASDEEAIAELIQVRGIGRWTAQMYLIFSLGRPDVFAPDDLGLKNAVTQLYGFASPLPRTELDRFAERWAPWRSVAAWYLWRAADQGILQK